MTYSLGVIVFSLSMALNFRKFNIYESCIVYCDLQASFNDVSDIEPIPINSDTLESAPQPLLLLQFVWTLLVVFCFFDFHSSHFMIYFYLAGKLIFLKQSSGHAAVC